MCRRISAIFVLFAYPSRHHFCLRNRTLLSPPCHTVMPVQSNLVDYENLIQLNRRPQNWQYTHSNTQAGRQPTSCAVSSFVQRSAFCVISLSDLCMCVWTVDGWDRYLIVMRCVCIIFRPAVHELNIETQFVHEISSIDFCKIISCQKPSMNANMRLHDKAFANLNRREHLPHICQIAEKLIFTVRLDSCAFVSHAATERTRNKPYGLTCFSSHFAIRHVACSSSYDFRPKSPEPIVPAYRYKYPILVSNGSRQTAAESWPNRIIIEFGPLRFVFSPIDGESEQQKNSDGPISCGH